MHPPSLPVIPAEDFSSSPTLCSSLDPCSSHGLSSLQSPSAFPSFFSDDSSQQIETFQPLSLDSSELCRSYLPHCCRDISLDITQDDSVSQTSLNTLTSEEGPLLHLTDFQKLVCTFHSSPNKIPSRHRKVLQKDDCITRGSLLQESAPAEHSISLPSYLSSLRDDTESSALLPIQDRDHEKGQPAFSEFNFQLLSSSPDPREHSALLLPNVSDDIYSKTGYAFHSQIDKTRQFESFDTLSQINVTACIDAGTRLSCYKSVCIMPLEVASSVLISSTPSFPTLIRRHEDADDKEILTEAHINGSRERRVQLLGNLCSVESKLNHTREGKKESLHERKKTMYSSCKEMSIKANAIDEGSKENIRPHVFEQAHSKVGGVKANSSGWMCPKDAKKKFKPKPRQLLIDNWLARQR